MSHATRLQRGFAAERVAAGYLGARGLEILARNLRCKAGELDLVCLDGAVLVIVEVRLREHLEFGGALASVTWEKRRKIIRTTQFFLRRHADWRSLAVRFDVLGVQGLPDGTHRIAWIKDAFRAT
jgi:putative endonuclease